MSRIGYEKLSKDKISGAIESIRVSAIESLVKADLSQEKHSAFFKKASVIADHLKSARKYEASAGIALTLLRLETGYLEKNPKSDSKTGLLLSNEILRYGNKEQIDELRKEVLKLPRNCQIKFYTKSSLIIDERLKSQPEDSKCFAI